MHETGISAYFRGDRIRIMFKTFEDLGHPEYIHLRLNAQKKHLFVEKCEWNKNSFRLEYDGDRIKYKSCYIHTKRFLRYMAAVIGVPADSPTLRFKGQLLPDGRVFVDLNEYKVVKIERKK